MEISLKKREDGANNRRETEAGDKRETKAGDKKEAEYTTDKKEAEYTTDKREVGANNKRETEVGDRKEPSREAGTQNSNKPSKYVGYREICTQSGTYIEYPIGYTNLVPIGPCMDWFCT